MSVAHAVAHGDFGRACLYALDRAMVPHAHREGHLILHIAGPAAEIVIDGRAYPLSAGKAVAINPWQQHFYRPLDLQCRVVALVLYIRPDFLMQASGLSSEFPRFGRPGVDMVDGMAAMVETMGASLAAGQVDSVLEDRLSAITRAALEQTWCRAGQARCAPCAEFGLRDFRIRRALRLLDETIGEPIELSEVSRAAGLSRPHFFKLFREQIGVPPTIYVNALRMERAIDRLATGDEAIAEIGLDLGFATPASFSRFFMANGVVPPSAYRRSVVVRPGGPNAGFGWPKNRPSGKSHSVHLQ